MALIFILFVGGWFIDVHVMGNLTRSSIRIADQAVSNVTASHVQHSDDILTRMGEYVVKDKAEDVARELAYVLKGKRPMITPNCAGIPGSGPSPSSRFTPRTGPEGYTDLYDSPRLYPVHPDKNVEGRNQLDWEKEYPETTELIKRSFKENQVQGFFTFFDKDKRQRQRFSVRVHVPGTPFIAAAIVNLDEFFLPAQQTDEGILPGRHGAGQAAD